MLILSRKTDANDPPGDYLVLAFDARNRSRLKVTLASGREAGIFLDRGEHLHGGDRLLAEDGTVVAVAAAPEPLIEASADNSLLLARAAYHLGNRHVPVQILTEGQGGKLRFQTDHVLAEMARGLGCRVAEVEAPFEPESGAYGGHHHGHAHPHDPGHGPHRSMPKIHEFGGSGV